MFTISQFLSELKKNGLPATKPSVVKYEEMGVITPPAVRLGDRGDRVYTQEEVSANVEKIKAYREKTTVAKA